MANSPNALEDFLSLGIIQTSLDYRAAWKGSARMQLLEEEKAIAEIRRFFAALRGGDSRPDVILLPELAVPRGFEFHLRRMAESLQSIVIAGLDYRVDQVSGTPCATNEAVIIIPKRWRNVRVGPRTTARYIRKAYAAPGEEKLLSEIGHGFAADGSVWIFDGGEIGRFAIAICYDFLDLDRVAMYRGQIQHLFILAYNKDISSFDHVAEAMARMIFCNVVICNCGYWGGSLAVAPYWNPASRIIYRHAGAHLSTAQVISLPVRSLQLHQSGSRASRVAKGPAKPPEVVENKFKSLPPGFKQAIALKAVPKKIR